MEAHQFAIALKGKLRQVMNQLADQICERPLTIEDYRHAQGQIVGLAIAERELLDLSKSAQLDEVDDPLS